MEGAKCLLGRRAGGQVVDTLKLISTDGISSVSRTGSDERINNPLEVAQSTLLPGDFVIAGVMPKSLKSVKRRQIFEIGRVASACIKTRTWKWQKLAHCTPCGLIGFSAYVNDLFEAAPILSRDQGLALHYNAFKLKAVGTYDVAYRLLPDKGVRRVNASLRSSPWCRDVTLVGCTSRTRRSGTGRSSRSEREDPVSCPATSEGFQVDMSVQGYERKMPVTHQGSAPVMVTSQKTSHGLPDSGHTCAF